jgi:CheY-like chemotaxis protein
VGKPVDILLVEDTPCDVLMTREALKEGGVVHRLSVVENGVEAMAFLRRQGKYAEAPRPRLVFLDLNLPKKDGCETLAEVKADETLRRIPVVILTASRDERDILKAYDLHANCYVTKPTDLDEFMRAVAVVGRFWVGVVELPPKGADEPANMPGL